LFIGDPSKVVAPSDLTKLEWPILTAKVAAHAQTDEGRAYCLGISPALDRQEIESRWQEVLLLRDIARTGYKAPIGELKVPLKVFKASEKGQILEGSEFRIIFDILSATKRVLSFAGSFAPKSSLLQKLRSSLYALQDLAQLIEKTVTVDGQLKDDASPDLAYLRQLKTNLRKRIEENLDRLLSTPDVADYLQDLFYTVRNEKYVIPIRLDGRGRIKGQIIDTSDSGQTLFLEPASIAQMNQDLHDLDVAEKLEIIKIFRELSAAVAKELETIRRNYDALIDLDTKSAEAAFAVEIDAGAAEISDTPCIQLIEARHPLIKTASGKTAVANTIILNTIAEQKQSILIVSGPNAGGKTVVLKTVGLIQLMAKAGLLLPIEPNSKLFLFNQIFLELGDNQNLAANLSTFSGHLLGLKPILESAGPNDLALLDELATGTEPNSGSAIAHAILEHLADCKTTAIVTTHFDSLKALALNDHRYRNASMEYALSTYSPTYRLILDVPGQSYGLELANQIGIPKVIIDRARQLRGAEQTDLDTAISSLQQASQQAETLTRKLQAELLEAESAKARWTNECKLLEEQRAKATRSVAAKIEDEVDSLRAEFEDTSKELKQVVKEIRSGNLEPDLAYEKKRHTEDKLRDLEKKVSSLASAGQQTELPGVALAASEITVGATVYVLPLKREGTITKAGLNPHDPIEVQVGIIKVRVSLLDLRKTRNSQTDTNQAKTKTHIKHNQVPTVSDQLPGFVPQTPENTLDLRGLDGDQAVERTLNFLDRCLRAEQPFAVIIHGHGGDRLKNAVRYMLKTNCPYNVAFRPGETNEGGDGVTVVSLK
jgi:DNA mismatch repair protein MutS2